MSFRIKITVDTGQEIFSTEVNDELRGETAEFLNSVSDMKRINFNTATGSVFLPAGMIQRSIFEIEDLE